MTATIAEPLTLDGVYDIPADRYHADPVLGGSLSSGGARKILDCPARFHYDRTGPKRTSKAFDIGHAAHKLILGAGPDVVVVDADNWMTKAAKEAKALAYEAGRIPVLAHEWEMVREMHAALRAHPFAGPLFRFGAAEQTLIWTDDATGVRCRAMVDYLRAPWLVDYKTADSVNPAKLARTVDNYGYHQQASFYLDGVRALGLADDPAFLFVAQEKEPPHLVTVFQLDAEYLAIGAARNQRAREMFRDCTASGVWPAYTTDVATIAPPRYVRYQHEEF